MKRTILVSLSLFAMIVSNGVVDAADKVRVGLEADSAFWFGWVKYSGYAVALGCAMEAPETFILIKRWWLLRFRDIEREETKEDKRSWIVPLAALGLLIIVVGIVAETYCEGKVSDVDALLRAHESDKITAAENEAASATRQAGTAASNAQIAKGSADAANTAAGEAQSKVKSVAEQADRIGGVLGESLALINARQVQDRDRLSAALKKRFKGRTIMLSSYVGDAEAWGLCTQLLYVVKSAEMIGQDECGKAPFTAPLISPLTVFGANWDEVLAINQPLVKIGRIGSSGVIGSPTLTIFVGVKSPFVIGETDQTRDVERRAATTKKAQARKRDP
jgi:hypothetical protein